MNPTLLQQACASTDRIIEGIGDDQLGLPTPCEKWDVRALLNHVLATLENGRALLSDTEPAFDAAPGELPPLDLAGDDPLKAYRLGVEALAAAAGDDAFAALHASPFGDMPGAVLAGFVTLDVAVHGWDLARATGQQATLDDGLAEAILAFAHQTLSDDMREPRIGPEVTVAADASATDRLVAFLGRRP